MHEYRQARLILLGLFICIAISIVTRVFAETTNYLSPDSLFYLRVAENILSGNGMVSPTTFPFEDSTPQAYFSIWPIGYPVLIAGFGVFLPNLIWASKAVNLFFLGASFVLLYLQYRESAVWSSFAYFSYGLTEVYSYTWSEAPFLFFLLLFLFQFEKEDYRWKGLMFGIILCCLFLLRYAGIAFWLFGFCYMAYKLFKKDYQEARSLYISLGFSGIVISSYLIINYLNTGYLTGANRIYFGQESWNDFLFYLTRGILNVFAYGSSIWFVGAKDFFALLLFSIQITLYRWILRGQKLKFDSMQKKMLLAAVFYAAFIVCVRVISPFDKFDYRILSPLYLIIAMIFFQIADKATYGNDLKRRLVFGFVLISYIVNLPNHFLLNKLQLL